MHLLKTLLAAVICASGIASALPPSPRRFDFASEVADDRALLLARHTGEEHHETHGELFEPPATAQGQGAASNASTPKPNPGHQHAHGTPQAHINETLILLTHDPDPLANWRYDMEEGAAHPSLLVAHIVLASLSFFAFLPISESASHR